MSTHVSPRQLALALLASLTLAGCPTTANPEPPDAFRQDGGRRDAFVEVADTGVDGGTVSDAGVDAFVIDLDSDVDGGGLDSAVVCDDPSGCYLCAPTTDVQFLNRCADPGVDCEPFPVTVARLPHLRSDGTVPPLP